jgi:hypothetical protein
MYAPESLFLKEGANSFKQYSNGHTIWFGNSEDVQLDKQYSLDGSKMHSCVEVWKSCGSRKVGLY